MEPYNIFHEGDLADCIDIIRRKAILHRFTKLDTEQFVLGISEIGTNAIRHANGGQLSVAILKNGGIIQVTISDDGPGIANIAQAKTEGYSTIRTSLGIGLMVADRSVDSMIIETLVDRGTTVILEKHRPISPEKIDYGLVSIADPNYDFNGDQYVLKEYNGDSVFLALIDGPGQGYDAYAIANATKSYLEKNYLQPLDYLLNQMNTMMQNSYDEVGITASLMRITPGKLIYKGYGDTHAYIVKEGVYHSLLNEGGRLGHVKKYRHGVSEYTFTEKLQVVVCTDGISVLPKQQALRGTAQQITNRLFDAYHKPHGDASLLSLKYLI